MFWETIAKQIKLSNLDKYRAKLTGNLPHIVKKFFQYDKKLMDIILVTFVITITLSTVSGK